MYTAVKEIHHLLEIDDIKHEGEEKSSKSATQVIAMIVLMNLIFSFDSILSALAITKVFAVLGSRHHRLWHRHVECSPIESPSSSIATASTKC